MPLPRPPKAVTFDCWMTLIKDVDSEASARARLVFLSDLAARQGRELTEERASELIRSSWDAHLASWREGRPFGSSGAARWCLERLGVDCNDELVAELAEVMQSATPMVGTQVIEGAAEVLDRVRAKGIATALICDTGFTPGRLVKEMLDGHGLKLDNYFFSDEVGAPKPYPPIFLAAIRATGASPEQMVHIGDLKRTDVAGARAAGMSTVRFAGVHDDGAGLDDPEAPEADAVLRSWPEAASLLGL